LSADASQAIGEVIGSGCLNQQGDTFTRMDGENIGNAEQVSCRKAPWQPTLNDIGDETQFS
jgi:hypothetical protein